MIGTRSFGEIDLRHDSHLDRGLNTDSLAGKRSIRTFKKLKGGTIAFGPFLSMGAVVGYFFGIGILDLFL